MFLHKGNKPKILSKSRQKAIKMKTKLFFVIAVITAFTISSLQNANAQSWLLSGNSDAVKSSKLGTLGNIPLKFYTNNTEQMRIGQTGSLGIGTATPWSTAGTSAKIVQLSATNFPQYLLQATNATADNKVWRMIARNSNVFQIQTLSDIFGTEQTAIQINRSGNSISTVSFPAGNVGIGTVSPGTRLEVLGGNWDVTNTEGDVRIGNSAYRLKIGVATGGGGAGDVRLRAAGGTNRIMIGINDALTVNGSGNIGIGTITPGYKLDVCGTVRAKELLVQTGWCDYVFDDNYNLKPLKEVEQYVKQNKHLPNIPAASDVEQNGLQMGDMAKKMMEKIEELTLYVIDLQKQVAELKAEKNK